MSPFTARGTASIFFGLWSDLTQPNRLGWIASLLVWDRPKQAYRSGRDTAVRQLIRDSKILPGWKLEVAVSAKDPRRARARAHCTLVRDATHTESVVTFTLGQLPRSNTWKVAADSLKIETP